MENTEKENKCPLCSRLNEAGFTDTENNALGKDVQCQCGCLYWQSTRDEPAFILSYKIPIIHELETTQ